MGGRSGVPLQRSPQSVTREVWLDYIDAKRRVPDHVKELMRAALFRMVTDLSSQLGALELTYLREKQDGPRRGR